MPAPNIYTGASSYPEAEVPAALKTNKVDLLYVTDRRAAVDDSGALIYGSDRSDSVAFGSVVVELGDEIGWPLPFASPAADLRPEGGCDPSFGHKRQPSAFPCPLRTAWKSFESPELDAGSRPGATTRCTVIVLNL